MASYTATLESDLPAEEAFTYLSDFSNTEEWDPGTVQAEHVDDAPIGEGSEFRLVAAFLGRESVITYRIVEYTQPDTVTFRGENSTVVSLDRVTVEAAGTGSRITYDATLTLKGLLRLGNPLLAMAFKRLGDRALAGMRATLVRKQAIESERVDVPQRERQP